MEDTFQAYSSFTTRYLPAQDYEKLLVSASKMRGQCVRNWERRETLESSLVRHLQIDYVTEVNHLLGEFSIFTASIQRIHFV